MTESLSVLVTQECTKGKGDDSKLADGNDQKLADANYLAAGT